MKSNVAVDADSGSVPKVRNLVFVLVATGVFLLKGSYSGPLSEPVHAYAGNLTASFALYFVFRNLNLPRRFRRLGPAVIVLAVVELFELFDGFGVMANTYDPIDLLANAAGVALAFWLDRILTGEGLRTAGTERS